MSEGGTTRVDSVCESLGSRLRLGSLTEDGLSYKEKFIVRSYEVGINKTATVETIANFLQVFFSILFLFTCLNLVLVVVLLLLLPISISSSLFILFDLEFRIF